MRLEQILRPFRVLRSFRGTSINPARASSHAWSFMGPYRNSHWMDRNYHSGGRLPFLGSNEQSGRRFHCFICAFTAYDCWPVVRLYRMSWLNSIAVIPGKSLTNGLLLLRQTKRAAVTTPDECLTSYEAFVSRMHNRLIQTPLRVNIFIRRWKYFSMSPLWLIKL